ncbi:MAG: hypothetical protein FJ118_20815 [Deltaproteobacteria bacterium]|nr:hypothetical protein [Deltaproteobacteria bacterium]
MNKLGVVFLLIVLVLTPVMPIATSADQGSPTATPTPTPTPTVEGAWGDLPGWANGPSAESRPEPEAMEDIRRDLLDLRDILEELYPCAQYYAQYYAQVTGQEPPALPSRQLIQALTPEELNVVREAFGDDYEPFQQSVKALKSLILASEKEPGEGQGQPSLSSFTTIPTPTPVTTPTPGITHKNHEDINKAAGDLEPPEYATNVGCPKWRYPHGLMLGLFIVKSALATVEKILDTIGCEGSLGTAPTAPAGCVGTSAPGCIGWGIVKGIALLLEAVYEGFEFCNGTVDGAELGAAYTNIGIIHADLHDHDRGLTTRFNTMDHFLFNFRNSELASRMAANLASPKDGPIASFALPRSVCISTDLETLQRTDRFAPEVIAGCGLLELISDTVRSAIDMNRLAGQSVHNAEAEFQAAVNHYNNGDWKLAYARFRSAYREAVRP